MAAEKGRPFDEISDFIDTVKEAAIEAEFETGNREATVEEAKAHILIRVIKIIGGFGLVILGIILMPLPGPGWVIVAAGLALLATEFVWAERLLQEVRKRMPGVPEDGKIPPKTIALYVAMFVVGTTISIVWGADIKNWLLDLF